MPHLLGRPIAALFHPHQDAWNVQCLMQRCLMQRSQCTDVMWCDVTVNKCSFDRSCKCVGVGKSLNRQLRCVCV